MHSALHEELETGAVHALSVVVSFNLTPIPVLLLHEKSLTF